MSKIKCVRIAKVSAKNAIELSTALKQANNVAQSFKGTLATATVVAQKRKSLTPYYDVYVKVQ